MRKMTPKEKAISLEIEKMFLRGGSASIEELMQQYWDVGENDSKETRSLYEKKTRSIIRTVANHLKTLDVNTVPSALRKELRGVGKLWLMAIGEEKKGSRKYKIVCTPKEEEIVSRLTFNRLEGMMNNHQERTTEAIMRHPKIFKEMIQFKKVTVPYLAVSEEKMLKGKNG